MDKKKEKRIRDVAVLLTNGLIQYKKEEEQEDIKKEKDKDDILRRAYITKFNFVYEFDIPSMEEFIKQYRIPNSIYPIINKTVEACFYSDLAGDEEVDKLFNDTMMMISDLFYVSIDIDQTWEVVFIASYLCNLFPTKEVYIKKDDTNQDAKHAIKKMDNLISLEKQMDEYRSHNKHLSPDRCNDIIDYWLAFTDEYKPSRDYLEILECLAFKFGVNRQSILDVDIDIRVRKLIKSIKIEREDFDDKTSLKNLLDGNEYMAFAVTLSKKDNEVGLYWLKVGTMCCLPGCNVYHGTIINSELSLCTKCRKAHYCGREHQKIDWKRHKELCPLL